MRLTTQEIIGSIILAVLLGGIFHSGWKVSRRFAPVRDRHPSGIGGWFLVIYVVAGLALTWSAASLWVLTPVGQVDIAQYGRLQTGTLVLIVTQLVRVVGLSWLILRMLTGRSFQAAFECRVAALIVGVGSVLVPYAFGVVPTELPIRRMVWMILGFVCERYIAMSPRARNTFGATV